MRLPDRPEAGAFDTGASGPGRDDLAERLSRLPDNHPSGLRDEPEGRGPDEPGPDADLEDTGPDEDGPPGPDPDDEPGPDGPAATGARPAFGPAGAAGGQDPYRPWFAGGGPAEPWFAAEPGGPANPAG